MGDVTKGLVKVAPGLFVDPDVHQELDASSAYVLLDEAGLRKLGLGTGQLKMLERLNHCGMVEIYPVTPRRKLLKLSSWSEHMAKVRLDPEFWENPATRRRWKLACLVV